jgi:hypothetical protein
MSSTTQRDAAIVRLFESALLHVEHMVAKGLSAREVFGDRVYQALIAERLFYTCALQDDSIDPATVVQILKGLHDELIEEMNA